MYCATRSPRVTCTLKILGLPGPNNSTSWMPACDLERQRGDTLRLPIDQHLDALRSRFDDQCAGVREHPLWRGNELRASKGGGHHADHHRNEQNLPERGAHRLPAAGDGCARLNVAPLIDIVRLVPATRRAWHVGAAAAVLATGADFAAATTIGVGRTASAPRAGRSSSTAAAEDPDPPEPDVPRSRLWPQ